MQEEVRRRFRAFDAGAIRNRVKQVGDAQTLDHGPGITTGRAERGLDARGAHFMQQFQRAGEQVSGRHLAQHVDIIVVFARHQGHHLVFGQRTTGQDDVQRSPARDAAQLLVDDAIEGEPLFVGQALPGAVMVFRSIGDNAIEIKDECLGLHNSPFARVGALLASNTAAGGSFTAQHRVLHSMPAQPTRVATTDGVRKPNGH